jgi:hypothetical protein
MWLLAFWTRITLLKIMFSRVWLELRGGQERGR